MIHERQVIFWVASFLVFILVLWLFSDVLLPFVIALALAYPQTSFVDRLERHGTNRILAALLIVGMFAFGYLFGLVGLLISVLLAAAAVLFRFALKRNLASPIFTGENVG
jgi:predicted PurR-regulated permease PerM